MAYARMRLTGEIRIPLATVPELLADLAAGGKTHADLDSYLKASFGEWRYEDEWAEAVDLVEDGDDIVLTPELTFDCGFVRSVLRLDAALGILQRYSHGEVELFHVDEDDDWCHRQLSW